MPSLWAAKFVIHLSNESSSSWYNPWATIQSGYRYYGELLWRQWDSREYKSDMGDRKWERIQLQSHILAGFLDISSDIFTYLVDNF